MHNLCVSEIDLRLEDYDFALPESRIAQRGAEPRDASKLLLVERHGTKLGHKHFSDITDFLEPGDVLILNRSKVIPARLLAKKKTGGRIEVLLLRETQANTWSAFLKPARRVALGERIEFGSNIFATVENILEDGVRLLHFSEDVKPHLETLGAVPLPPYISGADSGEMRARYQTVYATDPGSVAAPTAGLHFTQNLLEKIHRLGVGIWPVTLHVGAGTFKPIATTIEDHVMHREPYFVPLETAQAINTAKAENRRVIAVGTTSVRTLESAAISGTTTVDSGLGESQLFIKPGYNFQIVDGLITNFHLPRSTLLMLVAAFAGLPTMQAAYQTALASDYRFYSFGDAMFIF